MTDLAVLVADTDAKAVFGSVLRRTESLGIRKITWQVERLPGHDSGMVKEGPETARLMFNKRDFSRLLLVWDYHGCGRERSSAESCQAELIRRLEGITWIDRSEALILVPELEEWLWHSHVAIKEHCGLNRVDLDNVFERCSRRFACTRQDLTRRYPKEVFHEAMFAGRHRRPRPADFGTIADRVSLAQWEASPSFARLCQILRTWFPPRTPAGRHRLP